MGFKVDFSGVEVRTFEAVPAGWYHVKVTDGELKESGEQAKNPGAEYINWEFTIQDGPYENQHLWAIASLLPHALFTLKGMLGACGWDVDGALDFEIDEVIGKDLMVKAVRRPAKDKSGATIEGEFANDVKSFKPFTGEASATSGSVTSNVLP